MNIKMFFKISNTEDVFVKELLLLHLLEHDLKHDLETMEEDFLSNGINPPPNFEICNYIYLTPSVKDKYRKAILDLCEVTEDAFENLLNFFIKDGGLDDLDYWFREQELEDDALDFDLFKPLSKSPIFRDYLTVNKNTGEVFAQVHDCDDGIDPTKLRLFNQLESILIHHIRNPIR